MSALGPVTTEQEVLLHLAHLCGQLQLCQETLNRTPDDKNANGAACHLLERVAASYAKLDPYLRVRIYNPACLNATVRLLYQVLLFAAWLSPLCFGAVNEAWGLAASLASTLCHILVSPVTQQPSTIWGPRLRAALMDSPVLLNRPRKCLHLCSLMTLPVHLPSSSSSSRDMTPDLLRQWQHVCVHVLYNDESIMLQHPTRPCLIAPSLPLLFPPCRPGAVGAGAGAAPAGNQALRRQLWQPYCLAAG